MSDERSGFSNYGSCIQVYGPGSNVYSSVPGNGYATYSGTSMACPHTAGVVALYGTENPCLTGQQLFDYVAGSATPNAISDHDGGGTPGATPNLLIYTRANPRAPDCPTPTLPDIDPGGDTTCNPTAPPTYAPTAPTTSPTVSPTSPTASPQPFTPDNYMCSNFDIICDHFSRISKLQWPLYYVCVTPRAASIYSDVTCLRDADWCL